LAKSGHLSKQNPPVRAGDRHSSDARNQAAWSSALCHPLPDPRCGDRGLPAHLLARRILAVLVHLFLNQAGAFLDLAINAHVVPPWPGSDNSVHRQ
jgi:hypothetical protein